MICNDNDRRWKRKWEKESFYQVFILLLNEASIHDFTFKKKIKKKDSESWISIDNKSHWVWMWTWTSISEDVQQSSLLLESHTLTHLKKQVIQEHATRCDMKIENKLSWEKRMQVQFHRHAIRCDMKVENKLSWEKKNTSSVDSCK